MKTIAEMIEDVRGANNRRVDLTGRRFGRLVVVERSERQGKSRYWHCVCDCGRRTQTRTDRLLSRTRSCGCESAELLAARSRKHGKSSDQLYRIWYGMMARCHNTRNPAYPRYGGRGITVCERWHDLGTFIRDISPNPGHGASLDRINNEKGYQPNNVRWASPSEQARNTRATTYITVHGTKIPLTEAAEDAGLKAETVRARIFKYGWSPERAITLRPYEWHGQ